MKCANEWLALSCDVKQKPFVLVDPVGVGFEA